MGIEQGQRSCSVYPEVRLCWSAPGAGGFNLGRLLQVGAKVLPADAGEAEGGRDLGLGEVQPPRFGEEVGFALGEAGVVEGGGEVDL